MKTLSSLLTISALIAPFAFASEGWETNMDAAKKKAAEENKGLLIEFTGSDWCGPCINMKKTVLVKDEFLNAAQKGFVLVELDFPSKPLSPEQTAHNKKYGSEYSISGYPTVIFTDAEGRPVHSFVGGRDMKTVLGEVETASKNKVAVADALTKLKDAKGDDRYKIIGSIFEMVPVDYMKQFYPELADELKNDTKDVSGTAGKLKQKEEEQAFQNFMRSIPRDIGRDPEKFVAYIDEQLGKNDMSPEIKQKIAGIQANVLQGSGKLEEAIAKLKQAVALAPDSEEASGLKERGDYLEKNIDTVRATMEQSKEFSEFTGNADQKLLAEPTKYVQALQDYMAGKDLTVQVRQSIMQEMAIALIADGKMDEALNKIQEAVDLDTKGESEMTEMMKGLKERIGEDKDEFEKYIKGYWKSRAAAKPIPATKIQ